MAKLRRPKNRLVQPRLRGLAGPFFQQIAPATLIHTPGNFIAGASEVVLESIAVTPNAGTINYGATQQFMATGTYSDASTANITGDVTWDSSDDAVATITAGGLATGTGVGTATISATLGAVSGNTTLAIAWIPALLFAASEVGGWYDPSDLSTMFQNSNGTTAVSVGDPVGYIADKSGNGKHAIQATAAARPVLRLASGKYYLEVDGTDDSLATASINFSGNDEATVCAGVNKTNNTAIQIIAELSASVTANVGSWYLSNGSATAGAARFTTSSRGAAVSNVSQAAVSAASYSGPITCVVTATHDISGDISKIRVNGGASGVDGTADKGSGNFGNYPLYIARRASASLALAGRIYGLIVRGKTSTAGEIESLEAWMNGKTGAY